MPQSLVKNYINDQDVNKRERKTERKKERNEETKEERNGGALTKKKLTDDGCNGRNYV